MCRAFVRTIDGLGLRTVLDLRADDGQTSLPRGRGRPATAALRRATLFDHGPVEAALFEACTEILADRLSQPVLVHCADGRHRTGAVVVTYRVRYCGWTGANALAEARRLGMNRWNHEPWDEYELRLGWPHRNHRGQCDDQHTFAGSQIVPLSPTAHPLIDRSPVGPLVRLLLVPFAVDGLPTKILTIASCAPVLTGRCVADAR